MKQEKGNKKMNLTNYEKETIILFNEAEETAEFYTCSKRWQTKLDELCQKKVKRLQEYKQTNVQRHILSPGNGLRFVCPEYYRRKRDKKNGIECKEKFYAKKYA